MAQLPDGIRTPRLQLRCWKAEDATTLNAAVLESIDHLRPWMPWIEFEPLTVDEREQLIVGWENDRLAGGDAIYGVFDGDGTVVAGCGLHRRAGPECLEVGYWVHIDHTGRGFATELTRYLTDAAFTVEGIERVELKIDQANTASGRVPDRLGFARGETTSIRIAAPGEKGIECCWFVDREDWPTSEAEALTFLPASTRAVQSLREEKTSEPSSKSTVGNSSLSAE